MSIELPAVSFISALIVLIPLPLHWRTRNVCTSSIMLWLAISNIYRGINIVLWAGNADVKYEIWCDIVVRVHISSGVGVPASVMCICRRLAQASSPGYKAPDSYGESRRMRFEIEMCVILPGIFAILFVVVQSHRFTIVEGSGCFPHFDPSIVTLFVLHIPPVLLSLVGTVYAGIALRSLIHRRSNFQQASSRTRPTPPSGQYIRFVALAIILMTFATVMSLFMLVYLLHRSDVLVQWTSWDEVHKHWREIKQSSKGEESVLQPTVGKVSWYFIPIACVMVFSFFGFDDRIISEYKSMFAWIKARLLGTKPAEGVVLPLSVNDAAVATEMRSEAGDMVTDVARDGVPLSGLPVVVTLA